MISTIYWPNDGIHDDDYYIISRRSYSITSKLKFPSSNYLRHITRYYIRVDGVKVEHITISLNSYFLTTFSHNTLGEFASTFTSKIAESADNFLASNPDLAKPTSAYASDLIANIYSDVVQPKMSSILATLDASPLAENTRQAIDQSPKLVQNAQELLSSRLAQLSEFKNKLSESAGVSDFLSASKSAVGSRINENFDKIISDYPQLKQSTSDFTVSAVNNEILPKIKETSEFLYNSPLGLNTREFAARSTSDVVSSFSEDVATRFAPYTDVIGFVGNRLFVRATSPFTDLVAGEKTLHWAVRTARTLLN